MTPETPPTWAMNEAIAVVGTLARMGLVAPDEFEILCMRDQIATALAKVRTDALEEAAKILEKNNE